MKNFYVIKTDRLDQFFFFQAEDGIRDLYVTGVQTCALPISPWTRTWSSCARNWNRNPTRSEEHTSELQSRRDLVCRLLLEKKKKQNKTIEEHNKPNASSRPHNDVLRI